jgi:hypothetical protein
MPSRIQRAGRGLFVVAASKDDIFKGFQKNDIVTAYLGETLSEDEINARYSEDVTAPYTITNDSVEPHVYLDAACRRGVAAFANHGGVFSNSQYIVLGGQMVLQALRFIKVGEEVTADYGSTYQLTEEGVSNRTARRSRRKLAIKPIKRHTRRQSRRN